MRPFQRYLRSAALLTCFISGTNQATDLSEIYSLASKNDHTFRAAEAQYKIGLEAKKVERANLLPNLSGSVSYTDVSSETLVEGSAGPFFDPPIFDPVTTRDSKTTGYELSLAQPLFDLAAWNNFKAGSEQTNAAEAVFRQQEQNLIIRAAEAYFNTLLAAANLQTSLSEETALKQQLTQSQQRYEVGLNAITEVHEAQASYDSAVAVRLSAEGQLGIQFELLEVLTGKSFSSITPLKEIFPVSLPTPKNREDWVKRATVSNYTLKSSKATADAAKFQAKAAKSLHYPTVSLNASYADNSSDTDSRSDNPFQNQGFQSDNTENTNLNISLRVPIFAGGSVSANRRRAAQTAIFEQENYLQTKRNIVQQTRAEHLNVITGVATVKARKQTTVSRQSALEATEAGYRVGTRDFVDVLNAQRGLYQAKRDYDSALYAYVLSSLRLKDVAGMLTEEDLNKLNQWLDPEQNVSNISLTY